MESIIIKTKDKISDNLQLFKKSSFILSVLVFLISFVSFFLNVNILISIFGVLFSGHFLCKTILYLGTCDGPNSPCKYNFSYFYLNLKIIFCFLFLLFINLI